MTLMTATQPPKAFLPETTDLSSRCELAGLLAKRLYRDPLLSNELSVILHKDVKAVMAKNSPLHERVDYLEEQINTLERDNEDLSHDAGRVGDLESQIGSLEDDVSKLEDDVAELTAYNKILRTAVIAALAALQPVDTELP